MRNYSAVVVLKFHFLRFKKNLVDSGFNLLSEVTKDTRATLV